MNNLPAIIGEFSYREQPGKWRFVLEKPLTIRFPLDWWGKYQLADDEGRVWSKVDGRDWTIVAGYAWDGASFAINFPSTLAASAWHDAAGQFRHLPCIASELPGWKWNRRFSEIISAQGDKGIAALYLLGLIIGNPFYSVIGKILGAKRGGRCIPLAVVALLMVAGCAGQEGSRKSAKGAKADIDWTRPVAAMEGVG